jgi:hypothetical protein
LLSEIHYKLKVLLRPVTQQRRLLERAKYMGTRILSLQEATTCWPGLLACRRPRAKSVPARWLLCAIIGGDPMPMVIATSGADRWPEISIAMPEFILRNRRSSRVFAERTPVRCAI